MVILSANQRQSFHRATHVHHTNALKALSVGVILFRWTHLLLLAKGATLSR